MRTIAQSTGLSVATVSRVLNGGANVRHETREIVQAAIRELGYSRNPAARALSTRRTKTIAAVVPTLAHSIFARFLFAVEQELAASGYALVIGTTGGDTDREYDRVREMLDLGAEGLILSGLDRDPRLTALIQAQDLPTVCTSVHAKDAALPTIGYDNRTLGTDAVTYLQSLGHRRIALVHGPAAENDRTRLRIRGVEDGLAPDASLHLFERSLDVSGGAIAARELFEAHPRFTAVLCLSDVLALGVLFEATKTGIAVPDQLSVMGFDDLDWAAYSAPSLTTIRLPVLDMGRDAARTLVERLDNGTAATGRKLNAEIVVRDSTAPVR